MSDYSWPSVVAEAFLGILVYWPIHALGSQLLFNPVGTPIEIWPLSNWLEHGPGLADMLIVAMLVFIGSGVLRAQRKELFDE